MQLIYSKSENTSFYLSLSFIAIDEIFFGEHLPIIIQTVQVKSMTDIIIPHENNRFSIRT